MNRTIVLIFGVASYALGVSALVGWILTMLGILPFQMGLELLPNFSLLSSLVVSFLFTLMFAVQHTIMARSSFKDRISKVIPEAAERSLFVLTTGLILWMNLIFWPKNSTLVWHLESEVWSSLVVVISLTGWAYLFLASFAINHFELFGLQQVFLYFRGRDLKKVPFRERWMYRFDRHPIMTGALIGMWFTPSMTVDHLAFASFYSLYIVFGVAIEERDLIRNWGEGYIDYKNRVGSLVPTVKVN